MARANVVEGSSAIRDMQTTPYFEVGAAFCALPCRMWILAGLL